MNLQPNTLLFYLVNHLQARHNSIISDSAEDHVIELLNEARDAFRIALLDANIIKNLEDVDSLWVSDSTFIELRVLTAFIN